MAYSDYGGYAYRNGIRVPERSDYTINPDGTGFGTPGVWPGFAMMAAGAEAAAVCAAIRRPHHHVVLGDGPILVGLHKQSVTLVYRNGERLDEVSLLVDPQEGDICTYECQGKKDRYLNTEAFRDKKPPPPLTSVGGGFSMPARCRRNWRTDMKLYRMDVRTYATVYVRAPSEREALVLATETINGENIEVSGDWLISDLPFDHEDLPVVSLSPALTLDSVLEESIEEVEST
jgi:hypothetical protein